MSRKFLLAIAGASVISPVLALIALVVFVSGRPVPPSKDEIITAITAAVENRALKAENMRIRAQNTAELTAVTATSTKAVERLTGESARLWQQVRDARESSDKDRDQVKKALGCAFDVVCVGREVLAKIASTTDKDSRYIKPGLADRARDGVEEAFGRYDGSNMVVYAANFATAHPEFINFELLRPLAVAAFQAMNEDSKETFRALLSMPYDHDLALLAAGPGHSCRYYRDAEYKNDERKKECDQVLKPLFAYYGEERVTRDLIKMLGIASRRTGIVKHAKLFQDFGLKLRSDID